MVAAGRSVGNHGSEGDHFVWRYNELMTGIILLKSSKESRRAPFTITSRPLPSSKNPHFQNQARCTTFLAKIDLICTRMKNDFHIKGWAATLVLNQRPGGTRKWPTSRYLTPHGSCLVPRRLSLDEHLRAFRARLSAKPRRRLTRTQISECIKPNEKLLLLLGSSSPHAKSP